MSTTLQPQQPPQPSSTLPLPSQYYHNHQSPSAHVDKIEDILRISDSFEMDQRIAKNAGNIIKIFQHFKNNLYKSVSFTKDEIDYFIYCLKFVDTLNLFMNTQTLSTLRRYMCEIYDVAYMTPNLEYKELIIKQIKYTEMTVIDLKKKLFKHLYFGEPKHLALEIEKNLEQVIKNGKFEQKLFKQLQNLFYVVQGRFDDVKKEELQHKMNEMKTLSIKYRKQQRFGGSNVNGGGNSGSNSGVIGGGVSGINNSSSNYYDNDKDFKNYSNVSESLVDYSDNFYENNNEQRMMYYDDVGNDYGYGSHHDNNRHFYSRHYQYGGRYHGRKYFESEGKEVEIPATSTVGNDNVDSSNNNTNGDNNNNNVGSSNKNDSNVNMNNDGIEVIQTNVVSSSNMSNVHHNNHHHHFNKNTFQNNNNNNNNTHNQHHNKLIHSHSPNPHLSNNPLTTTIPPSQSTYPSITTPSPSTTTTTPSSQQPYPSTQSTSTYSSSNRKKILTRKNKQRGITLVEVPLPDNISGVPTSSTNEQPHQQSHRKDSYTPSSNISNHYKNEGNVVAPNKTITKTDDTEIITTVINTNKQHGKYGYHQGSGYKGSGYGKGQYYGYNERYYHGRGDSYYHGGYQGGVGNAGGDYYNKRGMQMQGKKYYGGRPKLDFVEVEDIKPQEVEIKDEDNNGGDNNNNKDVSNENNTGGVNGNDGNNDNNVVTNQEHQNKDDVIPHEQQLHNDNTNMNINIENDNKQIEPPSLTNTTTTTIVNTNDNVMLETNNITNITEPTNTNTNTQTIINQQPPLTNTTTPLTLPSPSINSSSPQSQTPLPKASSEMDFQQTFLCPSSTEPEHDQIVNPSHDNDIDYTSKVVYSDNPDDNIMNAYSEEDNSDLNESSSDSIDNEQMTAQFKDFMRENLGDKAKEFEIDNYVIAEHPEKKTVFEEEDEDDDSDIENENSDELEERIKQANEILHHVPDVPDENEIEEQHEHTDEEDMNYHDEDIGVGLTMQNELIATEEEHNDNEQHNELILKDENDEHNNNEDNINTSSNNNNIINSNSSNNNTPIKGISPNYNNTQNINVNVIPNYPSIIPSSSSSQQALNNVNATQNQLPLTPQQLQLQAQLQAQMQQQQQQLQFHNQPNAPQPQQQQQQQVSRSNIFKDSLKNMDPKLLSTIQSKLNEDFNNQQHKPLSQPQPQQPQPQPQQPLQPPTPQSNPLHQLYLTYQNQLLSQPQTQQTQQQLLTFLNIINLYQRQFLQSTSSTPSTTTPTTSSAPSSQKQLPSNIISPLYANFLYRGRDSSLHREYVLLKQQEQDQSTLIQSNLTNFEDKILIPIYQRINFISNKRAGIYHYTFQKYKKLITRLFAKEKIIKRVKPYGSYMNNFLIDNGDIDICIVPKFNNVNDFASYLDKIKDEITNRNIGEHKLSYQNKRYVLLRIMDNQMKCIVDITAHTMLPIHNTNLIRLYSLFDQRFHIMGLYVKHWAKINKIHGAAEHYLSSYALLLMLIHFLQEIAEPHVLPNLQKIDPHKEIPYEYYYDGKPVVTNIYYEEDLNKIKSYMSKVNSGMRNTETPTALLIKFFEYYAYSFDSENTISIKRDILNNEPIRKKTENYAFSIEDPFDLYHNPGKSMMMNSIQYHKFLTAMKKEINFILNGEYVTRLDKILTNGGSGGSSAVVNSNNSNNNASANASGNNVNGDNSSNNNNNKA